MVTFSMTLSDLNRHKSAPISTFCVFFISLERLKL